MAETALDAVAADLRRFIELLPDLSNVGERLAEVRATLDGEAPVFGRGHGVEVIEVPIGRADGTHLRTILHRPLSEDAPMPALLHVHGGGYIAGSANRDAELAQATALELGCAVLTPDYRLAPEHPYPAPVEDVVLAYRWLAEDKGEIGLDRDRIAVRGVSAGGGLALGAALRLRDEGVRAPCQLVLVFPMIDDRTAEHPHTGAFVWTADNNRFGWDSYLAGTDRNDPPAYAVPARAEDFGGLAPVFLVTGAIDLFAGENLELARRLIDAGNALELHVYPGAFHGFPLVPCDASREYKRSEKRALLRAFEAATDGE